MIDGALMRANSFVLTAAIIILAQIIDPAPLVGLGHTVVDAFSNVSHTIAATLSAHPLEAVLGTAVAIEPISVGTKTAWHMMGISNAHGYKLIEQGEIDSYLEGRVRKVTVASVKAYIARKLEAAKKDTTPVRTEKATAASVARRAERKAEGTPRRGRPGLTPPPRAEHIEAIEG
jgi:hypothetical protein